MAEPIVDRRNRVQSSDSSPGIFSRTATTIFDFLWRETNFFRLHVSAFVFVPLIFSGIFYASNGRFHIPYIDSLFLCYSAMTDTGLATVNVSTLTAWQQVVLYLLLMLVSFCVFLFKVYKTSLMTEGRYHVHLMAYGND
jgi:hypothetical protein